MPFDIHFIIFIKLFSIRNGVQIKGNIIHKTDIKWLFQYNDWSVIFCFYNRSKLLPFCKEKYLTFNTFDGKMTLLVVSSIIYNSNSMVK